MGTEWTALRPVRFPRPTQTDAKGKTTVFHYPHASSPGSTTSFVTLSLLGLIWVILDYFSPLFVLFLWLFSTFIVVCSVLGGL